MKFPMMACDEDILKCMVFWTNFILALVGICLISIGIIYKINLEEISDAIPAEYNNLSIIPVLTIPVGTTLIALAVFGCYGCLTERIRFVLLYIVILICIFVIQIAIGINAFYKFGNQEIFSSRLDVTLENIFINYNQVKNKPLVDLIQHRLRCCGYNGSDYWEKHIPKSCHTADSKDIFHNPCNSEMYAYIKHCQFVLGTSISMLSFSEIIAAIVSLFFMHFLRTQSKEFFFVRDYSFENGII